MTTGKAAMRLKSPLLAAACLLLAGCSGSTGLTTGSLFGGSSAPAKAAPPQVKNDPTSRAFQVGTVSARAVKCGYNFDATRLKANFLAAEAAQGTPVSELGNVERTYDVAYNGVTKAIAAQAQYCSERKTAEIKQDLTRHLAGDYTPSPPRAAPQEDDGLFGFGGNDSRRHADDPIIAAHPMDNR